MKVYLNLGDSPNSGGMHRVWEGLTTYLPQKGIEIVSSPDQADVYHAHINLYEKVPAHIPLVVSSHGMLWESIWGSSWSTNRHLVESYLQADVVTTPSQFVADSIARNTLIKTLVVHHGIDSSLWTPGEDQNYVLWNKARVDPANDPTDMNVLARTATDTLFKSTFGEPTANVEILGLVSPHDMLDIVSHAGVYLDTAVESGGPCFGVLEAMSCGVPILAWNNGGNAEVIKHKQTGYLATPGDFSDLYVGLRFCQEHRIQLGAAARQDVVDHYQWEQVVDGYIRAYELALEAHEHPTKVSVIVPCYNLGKFLPNCLDSIITQTFQDWEVIVIDDASQDNSFEIASQYATKDTRIKAYHNDQNLHVSDTRNRGVELSHGAYILPLDADDRLEQSALETLVKALDEDRETHIVSGTLLICHESELTKGYYGGWPNNADPTLQLDGYNRLPYASMYRRHVWERVGGYRRRIRTGIEDADFWTRALSFGYKAKIIEQTTLLYTQRDNSLRSANPYGAEAWLVWFPWTKNREQTPYGINDGKPHKVELPRVDVSVVIPVGPGHAHHIQGCLDSLIAQTFPYWEAVVVNDTGKRWFNDSGEPLTPYVLGFPFVKFIDSNTNHGVAHARNVGVINATSDKIVFLDVDDVAQPDMLNILLKSQHVAGGWIYGDWVTFDGQSIKNVEAPDWAISGIMNKSLAPITGIYEKAHINEVGGFDETAPGWEDWDFQLRLLENGICGSRVAFPLISYHMHLGGRREENFSQKENLVQYIKDKHPLLYGKGNNNVACSRCGGKGSVSVQAQKQQQQSAPDVSDQLVLIKYTGPETQSRLFRSPSDPTRPAYKVTKDVPFFVLPADLEHFMIRKFFERVQQPPMTQPVSTPSAPVERPLVSDAQQVEIPHVQPTNGWEKLNLKTEVVTILQRQFNTPDDLRNASDAQILSVQGIGEARLRSVRKALANA